VQYAAAAVQFELAAVDRVAVVAVDRAAAAADGANP
jgi:hypothetical protein